MPTYRNGWLLMSTSRIIGGVILAVGVFALFFAYNATQAPLEEMSNAVTGRYSGETMWYFALGAAAVVGGGLLVVFGNRS